MVPVQRGYNVTTTIPDGCRAFEITKKGNLLSDSEQIGIYHKKLHAKKEAKKRRERRKKAEIKKALKKDKAVKEIISSCGDARNIEIIEEKKTTSTASYREEKKKASQVTKNRKVQGYTKEEKANFRKYMNRRKAYKKSQKKARQAARKRPSTEAGIYRVPDYVLAFSEKYSTTKKYFEDNAMKTNKLMSEVEEWLKHNDVLSRIQSTHYRHKYIIRSLLLFYQFHISQSSEMDHLLAVNYFLECGMTLSSSLIAHLARIVLPRRERKRPVVTESLSEFLEAASDNITVLFDSSIVESVRDIIIVGVSWDLIPKEKHAYLRKVHSLFSNLRPSKVTFVDALQLVLKAIARMVRIAELVIEGYPLTEAFLTSDPIQSSISEAQSMLTFGDRLYYGLPVEGKMCAKEFVSSARNHIDTLNRLKGKLSKFSTNGEAIVNLIGKLTDKCVVVERKELMTTRQAPVAVVIAGPPGIGKSTITEFVYQAFSYVKGRKFKHNQVFELVKSSPYRDGYDPWGTPIIHASEAGSLKTEFVRARGDPFVTEITSICDSLPYNFDMSDVADKGKTPCRPELMVIDTNSPDMNLEVLVENVSAYRRRFLYIEPEVKPQYRINGSLALDPKKADDGGNFYDKWYFNVYVHQPLDNKKTRQNFLMKSKDFSSDIYMLEKVFTKYCEEHIEQQEKMVFARDNHFSFDNKSNVIEDEKVPDTEAGALMEAIVTWRDILTFIVPALHFVSSFWLNTCGLVGSMLTAVMQFYVDKTPDGYDLILWMFLMFALWLQGHLSIFSIVLLCSMAHVNLRVVAVHAVNREIGERINSISAYRDRVLEDFHRAWSFYTGKIYTRVRDYAHIISVITTISAILPLLYRWLRKVNPNTEASNFMKSTEVKNHMNDVEVKYNCTKSYERIPVKGQQIWNVARHPQSLHKSGPLSLHERVSRNCRQALIRTDNGIFKTHILGVRGNHALINRHAFGKIDPKKWYTVSISTKGNFGTEGWQNTLVNEPQLIPVSGDIFLISLDGVLFKDIVKHFPVTKMEFRNAKGIVKGDLTLVNFYNDMLVADDDKVGSITLLRTISYNFPGHTKGDCGIPIVAERDSGSCVVGIHSAGSRGSPICYGSTVLQNEIESAISSVSTISRIFSESDCTLDTFSPHHKSPVRYEDLGSMVYMGSIHSVSLRQKSSLEKTSFSDDLHNIFREECKFVPTITYVPPLMQPQGSGEAFLSPYNVALKKMSKSKKPIDPERMELCVRVIRNQILKNFGDNLPKIQPLDIETAVNGAKCDPFIRRMDLSKAAGFGTPGKKRDYVERYAFQGEILDELDDSIISEVLTMIEKYKNGQNSFSVYKAQLKDEPRDISKVRKGKTRVFFSSPLALLILSRMFLAPFYTLMIEHSEKFYCALGIDMHKDGWKLRKRLENFIEGARKKIERAIMEGDYGGYDTSMPFGASKAKADLILALMRDFGFTEEQLLIVNGILSDGLFPLVDFIGELLMIPGLQPSGKYATAEDNSIMGLLLLVYMWSFGHDVTEFFDHVLPIVYGDDLLAAVRDAPDFNAVSYAELCETHTDMTFTASDKGEIDIPFLHPDEMTFLKRTFVYSLRFKKYMTPLDMNSIYKALYWRIPSKSVNTATQDEQTLSSMLYELFLHFSDDEEKFTKIRSRLVSLWIDNYDGRASFPTYHEIAENICPENDPERGGRQAVPEDITTESGTGWEDENSETENGSTDIYFCFGRQVDDIKWPTDKIIMIEEQINRMTLELKEAEEVFKSYADPFPGLNLRQIRQLPIYSTSREFKNSVDNYYEIKSVIHALKSSIDRLWSFLQWTKSGHNIVTESGNAPADMSGLVTSDQHYENVVDVGGQDQDIEEYKDYAPLNVGQRNLLDMSKFLARPLAVTSFSAAAGTDINYTVDLWDYFLSHPSIRAKVRNYAYIRGKMNVKIAISGTPFHYSKVLVSYQPMAGYNKNLSYLDGQLGGTGRFQALAYLSQSEYAKVIDVKSNQPLEMSFPFISPQPMLRLFNKSPLILPDTASFNDAVGFGKLYIQSINPVRSASSTPTPVSIFVYAHMTDVELGAPTGTVITIGTESGDERNVGPIEKMASRAAEVTDALSVIPAIAPFAKASSMTLKGLEGLSALFGFSVPTMDNEPLRVKPQGYQNGTQVIGYDTGKRITLDPKQELTVDPRIVGSDEDEMSLSYLSGRETLLDSFDWTDGTTPLSSSIWMAPVNPGIVKRLALGAPNPYLVVPTALAFASQPFYVWRGDIDFRFEVNCSDYHRGKFAIYFEPNISQNVVIDTVLDMNKQFVKVIDIQETRDVSFRVKWAFPRAWARVITSDLLGDLGTVGFLGDQLFDFANGYVAVTPFTSLQSPDGSDISVNVYISSENMMFNQVINTNLPTVRPTTESGRLTPMDVELMDLNDTDASPWKVSEVHYGEMPISFRSLMKRFSLARDAGDGAVTGTTGFELALCSDYPIYPHPNPDFSGVAKPFPTNIYGHLKYAYIGMRGGMRHRIVTVGETQGTTTNPTVTHLRTPQTTVPVPTQTTSGGYNKFAPTINGGVKFMTDTNAGVEFELPMYTNNLFALSFNDDPFPPNSIFENSVSRSFDLAIPTPQYTAPLFIVDDFASAEDFGFLKFQGAPPYTYTV